MKRKFALRGRFALPAIFFLVLAAAFASADDSNAPPPGKKDKCPVCGMFVYKYPDWVGHITFADDDSTFFFDGAKDLFKYYFNLDKYNRGKTSVDIAAIGVTEYYDMQRIDAKSAIFVIGSDVFGPMGKELIPFKNREDAEAFTTDHGGTKILSFDQITPSVIAGLD